MKHKKYHYKGAVQQVVKAGITYTRNQTICITKKNIKNIKRKKTVIHFCHFLQLTRRVEDM